jgi:hypothetical protein
MVTAAAVGSGDGGGGTAAACADTRLIGAGAHDDEGRWPDGCAEVFCGWMMGAGWTAVRGPIGQAQWLVS